MTPKKVSKIRVNRILQNFNLYYNQDGQLVRRLLYGRKKKTNMWKPTNPTELYTLGLLIFTVVLAIISAIQIFLFIQSNRQATRASEAALSAAEAAVESNDISRQIMIAEQRPWIKHEVNIGGPLSYTAEKGWHFPLEYSLTNIGKSPGTMVSFYAQMIPFNISVYPKGSIVNNVPQGSPLPGTDIAEELQKISQIPEDKEWLKMSFGQILFPNELAKGLLNINANMELFEKAKEHEGFSGQFLVLVCVKYGSTLNDEMYRTAKSYQLWKTVSGQSITLEGETISASELALTESPQLFTKIIE
ncbi:hypothetical protein [Flagellimonas pacifica]|uniref:Uncharacterized protein n=1 Tax=Flagellimonas pacifica TaxID=1247520 RepID=A0A285N1W5_9FLAO|nr:hypothetical protein [Allomuricauda parva]SNZ01731.1 hypothetical protein SAMN06265377_3573 [Allomuricauda parva]